MKIRYLVSIIIISLLFTGFIFLTEQKKDEIIVNDNKRSIKNGKIEIDSKEVSKGMLILVNKEHALEKNAIRSDLIGLKGNPAEYDLSETNMKISKIVESQFAQLAKEAAKDRVTNFTINSAYRDLDEQRNIYKKMGSYVALPAGYSEHNTGLALDVGSTQGQMENVDEGKWLEKNAWRYGFILRYPKDKTDITKIPYEAWHIRYVGYPHSAIMKKNNFVLEEYLTYLKKEKSVRTKFNGKSYHIEYKKYTKEMKVIKPNRDSYTISGNNSDGIIVTSEL